MNDGPAGSRRMASSRIEIPRPCTLNWLALTFIFFSIHTAQTVEKKMDVRVDEIVARIVPALIEIRRDIHCHPELSMEETRTAALVSAYFQKLGLEVRTGIGGREVGIMHALRL